MPSCDEIRGLIENLAGGEIAPSELELLQDHARRCVDCQALLELHQELQNMEPIHPPVPEAEFRALRSTVLSQIERDRGGSTAPAMLTSPPWMAFAAAALLLIGVFVGRSIGTGTLLDDRLLIDELNRQARIEQGPDAYWDSPLAFANVSVDRLDEQRINLEFDVCRRVDLVAPRQSPLSRNVLVHAILDPSSLGGRLAAIELASVDTDTRLHDALAKTLHKDPDPVVRLAALEAMTRQADLVGTQRALLRTLREDESVQLRLLALEHLVQGDVSPDLIRATIRDKAMASDPAVLEYAREVAEEAGPWF